MRLTSEGSVGPGRTHQECWLLHELGIGELCVPGEPEDAPRREARLRGGVGGFGEQPGLFEAPILAGRIAESAVTLPSHEARVAGGVDAVGAVATGHDDQVVARIEDDRLFLDPRTVLPEQDIALIETIRDALASSLAES